jgi:hypothetical protein
MNTRASKNTSDKQRAWNAAIQTRIASTASMLGSVKNVKMMGLAKFMSHNIQDQRVRELKSANGYRWIVLITQSIGKFYTSTTYFREHVLISDRVYTIHHWSSLDFCRICDPSKGEKIERSQYKSGTHIACYHHLTDTACIYASDSYS